MRTMSLSLAALALVSCSGRTGPAPSTGAAEEEEASAQAAPAAAASEAPAPDGEAQTPATPSPGASGASLTVGPLTVTPVYHGTLRLQHGETTVWIDPWSKADLEGAPVADVLILTDIHPDHLDEAAIAEVVGEETIVVVPDAVAEARRKEGQGVDHVMANGDTVEVAGLTLTAVPMYNHTRGPEEGALYHEPGRGNGYLIDVGDTRLYVAGDTACTDEMKALADVDLAFVPMNLP